MKDFLCGTALIEATIDQEVRVQAEIMLTGLARYLAKKHIKDQWRAMGRNVNRCNPIELQMAANTYLVENRTRLREQARSILNRVR